MSSNARNAPNRALLRTPQVAWPTILLGLAVLAGWATAVAGAFLGALPLGPAALLATACAYFAFTPMHDAAHRAVGRARWVNEALGRLAGLPLLAPFPAFRVMHLAHHKHTNEVGDDPDLWSGSGPRALLPLRWLTQDLHYYERVIRRPGDLSRAELAEVVLGVAAQVGFGALCVALGSGWTFLWVVLIPARLATAALAFAFDYLPHRPHKTPAREDRYRASHVFREPWLTLPLCGQNYHLVHHLYPAVPFYRYGTVWFDQREALLAKGASERGLFGA